MAKTIIDQKKESSLLSSFLFFLLFLVSLLVVIFFGNRLSKKNDSPGYKVSEEEFALLPEDLLPPENPEEEERLGNLNDLEINERIRAQNQWKKNDLHRLLKNRKINEKIDEFLKHFYDKFLEKGLRNCEKRWWEETKVRVIRPKKVAGRVTTEETLNSDIEKCKKIFPEVGEAGISWGGFAGWLTENEEGEKKVAGKITMGRCDSKENGGVVWQRREDFWGNFKESVCYWTNRRITIKLKPELFFLRYNYNSWVIRNAKTGKYSQLSIGWNQLVKTIAHELAHAVVNTILINDKSAKLNEGHGGLHDKITDKIEEMIKGEHSFSKNFRDYIKSF